MALQIHLLFTHSEQVFHFFRKLIIEKRIDNWIGDVVYDVHSVHKKHTSSGIIRKFLPKSGIPCLQQHDDYLWNITYEKNNCYQHEH